MFQMKRVGYKFVNIDDCYSEMNRSVNGDIIASKQNPSCQKSLSLSIVFDKRQSNHSIRDEACHQPNPISGLVSDIMISLLFSVQSCFASVDRKAGIVSWFTFYNPSPADRIIRLVVQWLRLVHLPALSRFLSKRSQVVYRYVRLVVSVMFSSPRQGCQIVPGLGIWIFKVRCHLLSWPQHLL